MRKMVFVLICFMCGAAFATSMCVQDDTVAVVFDPSVAPNRMSGSSIDTGNGTWNMTFSWGKIYGVGACVSANKGDTVTNLTDTINGVEQEIVGGEANGAYCYLRMTHPAGSAWLFVKNFNAASTCVSSCASSQYSYCGVGVLYYSQPLRQTMFSSVR